MESGAIVWSRRGELPLAPPGFLILSQYCWIYNFGGSPNEKFTDSIIDVSPYLLIRYNQMVKLRVAGVSPVLLSHEPRGEGDIPFQDQFDLSLVLIDAFPVGKTVSGLGYRLNPERDTFKIYTGPEIGIFNTRGLF